MPTFLTRFNHAAHALGLYHQFYEDNLCIYPQGFEVDWEQFFLDREER